MRHVILYVFKVVLVAAAYFITGKLSLLLAIPPGFATPVWPAAGIALASTLLWGYRVIPGVFIGSFATNLLISTNAGTTLDTFTPFIVASGIALSAVLQAAISRFLILRVCTIPNPFTTPKDIASLLINGGAIGCTINASLGSLTLLIAGIIPASAYWVSMFTWWVGDFIGVALFAPMLLVLANVNNSNIRKIIVCVPVIIFSLITILVFISEKNRIQQKQQAEFSGYTQKITSALENKLSVYLNILVANERFINASQAASATEFEIFTRGFLKKHPEIQSLSWNKKVSHKVREPFESGITAQGFSNFKITDRAALGSMVPAAPRDYYYPITYIVPFDSNAVAHGFDTYGPDKVTDNIRRKVLNQARDKAAPIATGKISIIQAEDQYGFIIYQPVFSNTHLIDSAIERREHILGYVAGVFIVPHMLLPIRKLADELGTHIVLEDIINSNKKTLLFDSRTANFKAPTEAIAIPSGALTTTASIKIAGRHWQLNFIQKPDHIVSSQGWDLWYVLIGGLLFSVCFGVFLLIISGKTESTHNALNNTDNYSSKISTSTQSTYFLPFLVSFFIFLITFILWQQFKTIEQGVIKSRVEDELALVKHSITSEIQSSLSSLNRMADRWQVRKGTPKDEWIHDATQYLDDFSAITTLEWVDKDFLVQWIEPSSGNEKAIGLNISFDETRKNTLLNAVQKDSLTLTPPLDLVQGYRAFIGYAPIHINNQFDGFIVGIYDAEKFIDKIIPPNFNDHFNIRVMDQDIHLLSNTDADITETKWQLSTVVNLYNRRWTVSIWPNETFINNHHSVLSTTSLLSGLLLSLLVGFTLYTLRISKKRSALLHEKTITLSNREIELRLMSSKLELILDHAGEGIFGIDIHGSTSFINQAAVNMLGYSREELVNLNMHNMIHHHYADGQPYLASHCKILATAKTGKAQNVADEVFWKRDGTSFPVEYSTNPIVDFSGTITGVVVVFRDISERLSQEVTVQKITQALDRTNHMAGIGGWEYDPTTNEINWTDQMFRIHDAPIRTTCLSMEEMLEYYDSDSQCIIKTAMDHAISGGEGWDIELPLTTASGRCIWIRMVGATQYTVNKTTLVGTLQDISEKKYYTDELKRSNKDLSDFAYVASHDLKAPLRGVDQLASWIEEDLADRIDEQTKEHISSIKKRVNRMKCLLDDLLEYSRAGQKGENLKLVNSKQLIEDIFELSSSAHKFTLKLDGDFPEFLTESVPLEKTFRNLISNAMKHHDADHGEITIKVTTLDNYYQFEVSDNGPGIPLEYTDLAFGMFQTLRPRDEVEGSGMGLAIVKKTLELLGGTIVLSANKPRGACFTFTWPKVID